MVRTEDANSGRSREVMMVDNPLMKTPGELVSEAREARAMSLSELSERTKIPPPILTAIELDEYHKISGPLYIKSFLRSCATELDLDSEHLIRLYSQYSGEVRTGSGQDETIWEEEVQIQRLGLPWHKILPVGGLILVVIGAVVILGRTGCQTKDEPQAEVALPTVQVEELAPDSDSTDAALQPTPRSPRNYDLDTLAGGFMTGPERAVDKPPEQEVAKVAVDDEAGGDRDEEPATVVQDKPEASRPEVVEQVVPTVATAADGELPAAAPGLPTLEFDGGNTWPIVLRIVVKSPAGIHVRQDGMDNFAPAIWPSSGTDGPALPSRGIRPGRAYRVREGWVIYWGASDHFELRLDTAPTQVGLGATLNGKPKTVRQLRPGQVMLLDAY